MPSARFDHAERVTKSVRYGPALADAPVGNDERLFQSWKRSLESYRLDPGRAAEPRILTGTELKDHQGAAESFLRIARHGVRRLHEQVCDANYVVLLTNGEGVTLDFIGNPTLDRELKRAGLYLGSCWSEEEEGTCGVGTAIIDGSPITVHKGEHFRLPNTTLTCSAAPVLDAEGRMLAILDASALNSPDDKKSQLLVLNFVRQCGVMIEDAYFLDRFKHAWIIQMSSSREFLEVQTDYLLAIDELGNIIAANRKARQEVLADRKIPIAMEQVFDVRTSDIWSAARGGIMLPLREAITARTYFSYVRAAHGNPPIHTNPQFTSRPPQVGPQVSEDDVGGFAEAAQQIGDAFADSEGGDTQRIRIVAALRHHAWQVSAAARELGVSRATLYRHIERLGILSPNKQDFS